MALTTTQVSQLYVTLFGRASEGEGNQYWATNYDDQFEVAKVMLTLDVVKEYFGDAWNDNKAFIEAIYQNTLGKDPAQDQDGVNYWLNELNSYLEQGMSLEEARAKVVVNIINAISEYENSDDPVAKAAALQFKNKVAVSDYVAEKVTGVTSDEVLANIQYFKDVIANVTDDPTTVEAAKQKVDADLVVKNVSLTMGADDVKGSVFSDTFRADLLTINDGDKIVDPSTTDNDTLSAIINANVTNNVTITNVENIVVTSYGNNSIDMENITGVKSFVSKDSTGTITLNNIASADMAIGFEGSSVNNIDANYKAGALSGTSDTLTVNLNSAKNVNLTVDAGFEAAKINATGTGNTLSVFTVPGIASLEIAGDGDITVADNQLDGIKTISISNTAGVELGAINGVETITVDSPAAVKLGAITGIKTLTATSNTGGVVAKTLDSAGYASDVITGNSAGTTILLGSGNDNLQFVDGANAGESNIIKLGAGDDKLRVTTNNGYTYVFGEDGNDDVVINAIDTNDLVDLGAGTDTLTLDNANASTAILRGVENLVIKARVGGKSVTINAADSALNVTAIAEADGADVDVENLTAGSTVTVNAAEGTTNSVDALKVTYKDVEDSTTIKVNTAVTATANTSDMTIENVKDLTLEFAKAVDLKTLGADLVLNDKVESLTIKASDDVKFNAITDEGTAGLKTITVTGSKVVDLGDITNEDVLTSLSATATDALTVGNIQVADKLTSLSLTGKSVTLGEVGNNGANAADNLNTAVIAATGGDVVLQPTADGNAAIAVDNAGTVEIKADAGSILVNDTDDSNGALLLSAGDTDGITVKLSAKNYIGADDNDDIDGTTLGSVTVENTAGDITAEISGSAEAKVNFAAGDLADAAVKGVVNLTATNTGGLTSTITLDAATDDGSTSTISLGNAESGKVNDVTIEGTVQTLTINGGSGVDVVTLGTATNGLSVKTATIALGGGTDKLDLTKLANLDANGVGAVINLSSFTQTVDGVSVDAGKIVEFDGTDDGTNNITDGYTITVNDVEEIVGTDGNDVIFAANTGTTITGGAGNDEIYLGAGADKVILADTAANNGADVIHSFASGTDKVDVSAFETAGSLVQVTGNIILTDGTVYYLEGQAAGAADSAAAVATAVSNAANIITEADVTAWILIVDDNSSAIYEYKATDTTDGVTADELTLVATFDTVISHNDLVI